MFMQLAGFLKQAYLMRFILGMLLWFLLLAVCWPLALLFLVLFPIIWLILLPFRIIGITVEAILKLIGAILTFPFRVMSR